MGFGSKGEQLGFDRPLKMEKQLKLMGFTRTSSFLDLLVMTS